MKTLYSLFLLTVAAPAAFSANLAISTYLRDGFIPSAIASDPQGNVYLAGIAITDPVTLASGAAVIKVNANATQYIYFAQLNSAAGDSVSGIAVDGGGNAYIAGSTTNPNFPVFGVSGVFYSPSGNANDIRSFLIKLNPQGVVVFSLLLGGSTPSTAKAIALTPQGQILVSGLASASGFPVTSGAYSVPDSKGQWFLTKLDSAAQTVFSATGIGGSSLALDPAGNIYMAGSSPGTTYPTTSGAYQAIFTQGYYCFGFCRIAFAGGLQHVTKTDPAASRLIYSTGLNDPNGRAGNTVNTGLAVDSAGNAYVTGTLLEASYPFTTSETTKAASSYLTKLDAAGANILFSIPAGGAGVQLDAAGAVHVGGAAISINTGLAGLPGPEVPVFIPAFFSSIPSACKPDFITSVSGAYVLKIDPATGKVQDGQWIAGSAPGATAITLASGKVWITGPTPGPQVPHTPGVLAPWKVTTSFQQGVYLGGVDFAASPAGPSVACVVDSANFSHTGVLAPLQLITIMGSGLGPTKPVAAPAGEFSLGGVSVTFDGAPAKLLYVSESQINVAVPGQNVYLVATPGKTSTVMQLSWSGNTVERQFPITTTNLSFFADLSDANPCSTAGSTQPGFQPLAFNADGSLNHCDNPAKAGSVVSLLLNGAGGYGATITPLQNMVATLGYSWCAAIVDNPRTINDYVLKVDLNLPASFAGCGGALTTETAMPMTLTHNNAPVGPFAIQSGGLGANVTFASTATPMTMVVWVKP